jgi:hypothetical protein
MSPDLGDSAPSWYVRPALRTTWPAERSRWPAESAVAVTQAHTRGHLSWRRGPPTSQHWPPELPIAVR